MNLFDLSAVIKLDTNEYEQGLNNASTKASSFGKNLKTAIGVGTKAIAALGTATAALGVAFLKSAGDVATYGDNIDKMSQKMGISAQAYQEWDAIMQHSGTSIDSMQRGMMTLSKAAESGSDAFEKLGITQEEIASMNQEELFAATIAGLQDMEAGTERNVLAQELLGGSAKELGALLNTSAEETEAMRQKVHELGGVMSDEAVKSAAKYKDSLQDMKTAFSGLSRNMMSDFLPALTTIMDGLSAIFSGDSEGGLGMIADGITSLATRITEAMPRILEVGSGIVLALSQAIVSNLPQLLSAGSDAVIMISSGLISQLPSIIRAGLEIIVTLARSLAASLPELIPTIVDVVMEIVDVLTDPDVLSNLIEAALAIMIALAQGVIDAMPRLLEKAPVIIENLVNSVIQNAPKLLMAAAELVIQTAKGIVSNLPRIIESGKNIVLALGQGISDLYSKLVEWGANIINTVKEGVMARVESAKQWGKDLINNFVNGLKEAWNSLKSTVSNIAGSIKDYLGFSEPKKGPLSDFHTYAPDMVDLWNKTLKENDYKLQRQFEESFDFQMKPVEFSASGLGVSAAAMTDELAGSRGGNAPIELTANLVLPDGTAIARYLLSDLINVARSNGTPILNAV